MAKGYALLVGVKSVDPSSHDDDDKREGCEGCEVDVDIMSDILQPLGYDCVSLKTEKATHDAVIHNLTNLAQTVTSDDIFIFYFSGHGGQRYDFKSDDRDESDGQDETLVTYDRDILDDEIGEVWQTFPPNTRIVTISDSCNSGTVYKSVDGGALAAPALELFNESLLDGMQAQLIHFAGCKDGSESLGGSDGSALTLAIQQVWDLEMFSGDYVDMFNDIKELLYGVQVPSFDYYGEVNDDFKNSKPFTI